LIKNNNSGLLVIVFPEIILAERGRREKE